MPISIVCNKETEEGRDTMCEAVEKYAEKKAEKKAEQTIINNVKALMDSMKWTLEQSLDALKIEDKDRPNIIQQIQK